MDNYAINAALFTSEKVKDTHTYTNTTNIKKNALETEYFIKRALSQTQIAIPPRFTGSNLVK